MVDCELWRALPCVTPRQVSLIHIACEGNVNPHHATLAGKEAARLNQTQKCLAATPYANPWGPVIGITCTPCLRSLVQVLTMDL